MISFNDLSSQLNSFNYFFECDSSFSVKDFILFRIPFKICIIKIYDNVETLSTYYSRNFFFQPFHMTSPQTFDFVTGGEEGFDLGVAEHGDYFLWPLTHTDKGKGKGKSGNG